LSAMRTLKLRIADKVRCEVSNVDAVDRRLTLTMKDIGMNVQPDAAAAHVHKPAQASTLGELIKQKLGEIDLKK